MCKPLNHVFDWDRKGVSAPPKPTEWCNCGHYTYDQWKELLQVVSLPKLDPKRFK